MADMTPRQQLAETEKQLSELTAKVEALRTQTREEDLATAKLLIKTHSFTATDLRPELKAARSASTATKKASPKRATKRK